MFHEVGKLAGEPVFERLRFNVVNFDNNMVDSYIEPVNDMAFSTVEADIVESNRTTPGESPRVSHFEFLLGHGANPFFELQQFD